MIAGARRFGQAALFGALMSLAACGSRDDTVLKIAHVGKPADPFSKGIFLPPAARQVEAATTEGLVAFDSEGRVVPALADRWIVTDDGLSYIFRLREGTWRDGSELTAQGARAALRDRLRALRGTSLGLDLAGIEETRVMAERVIEIRLARSMPNLLQLLAQPEIGLTRKGAGAGPMVLERNGRTVVLDPIPPQSLGMPGIENWDQRVRSVRLAAMPAADAVALFNEGEVDLVLGGSVADFPASRSVGLLRGTIQVDPVEGLLGLSVLNDRGFLASASNREALALAIDRQALIDLFGIGGWLPRTRLVAEATEDDLGTIGERWADIPIETRRAQAAARVAAFRQDNAEPVKLVMRLPAGPGSDLLFAGLSRDFAAIGLSLTRAKDKEPADLELIDDVARYPSNLWYLNRLNCTVRKSLCSADADTRVREALASADPTQRSALLAEAEAELTQANVFIPIGAPIRWSLVRSDAIGFAPNQYGWHPLMPMALRPR